MKDDITDKDLEVYEKIQGAQDTFLGRFNTDKPLFWRLLFIGLPIFLGCLFGVFRYEGTSVSDSLVYTAVLGWFLYFGLVVCALFGLSLIGALLRRVIPSLRKIDDLREQRERAAMCIASSRTLRKKRLRRATVMPSVQQEETVTLRQGSQR